MDEPESLAGLSIAAREGLDNLAFVINCNLQRLDGPVRSNGQIIQELERLFRGAGWHVVKVLWGSEWDPLFARDRTHALLRRLAATVDGKYQTLGAKDGAYNLEHFFDEDPEVRALVSRMSDREIDSLKRGGHDFRKLYAAFEEARTTIGRPTVILAKTKKGYGMGEAGESRMIAHQAKKLDVEALKAFRDRLSLPLSDDEVERLDFYRPPEDSPELVYLRKRRRALGGYLPARRRNAPPVAVPPLESYARWALQSDGRATSTTVAIVRLLANVLKDPTLGPRIVPIIADEARTFGMRPCSARSASIPRSASSTSRRMPARCSPTGKQRTGNCWRRASPRPARSHPGRRRPHPIARMAWPCCLSISSTRSSASSGLAT
jgi:pyruvate dehydrogenase E1 component